MIYGILEIEIMNAIWSIQETDEDRDISVGEVVEALSNNAIDRAYTTIKTVMDRLVSKDLLVRYKNGKKFFYRSTIDKAEAARKTLADVSSNFFNGSYSQMIRFMERECEHILV